MKIYFSCFLIFFVSSTTSLAEYGRNITEIVNRINIYSDNPTKENAIKALEILPNTTSESIGRLYSDNLINNLESKINNDDATAIELAIRLLNVADGAFAFDLYAILVDIIVRKPVLFLEQINKVKDDLLVKSLVLNMAELDVEGKSKCSVLLARKKAFESVTDEKLEQIREKSTAILDAEYKICTQQGV